MHNLAKKAKDSTRQLLKLSEENRREILRKMAGLINDNVDKIIEENHKDLKEAELSDLSPALRDRLLLTKERIQAMASGVLEIAEQEQVVGNIKPKKHNENGLAIKQQQIPLGVILMIFESRPNVVIDAAALSIKSGNAILLKGGKEANYSNDILGKIVQESLEGLAPTSAVQVLGSTDRAAVNDLLAMSSLIDVVIPRGGTGLIKHVYDNAKMPVIAHYQGLCHIYLDKDCDITKAKNIVVNAKTQRPGVCNAVETLLVHEDRVDELCSTILPELEKKETELRVDENIKSNFKGTALLANDEDWATEYLSNTLSIKSVPSIDAAIDHIHQFGSNHTECIVSESEAAQDQFLSEVDSSCVMINASTRFNDGGQLGLGAEIGISTSKLHAYGPMGAEQLTTTRSVVIGDGHVR